VVPPGGLAAGSRDSTASPRIGQPPRASASPDSLRPGGGGPPPAPAPAPRDTTLAPGIAPSVSPADTTTLRREGGLAPAESPAGSGKDASGPAPAPAPADTTEGGR
jgi:hypothetical protein